MTVYLYYGKMTVYLKNIVYLNWDKMTVYLNWDKMTVSDVTFKLKNRILNNEIIQVCICMLKFIVYYDNFADVSWMSQ